MRAFGNPAVQYGAKVVGMTPSVFAKLRTTITLGLPDRAKAASVTLQFKLCGNEHWGPTFATIMAPVICVSKFAFGFAEEHRELHTAWKKQVVRIGKTSTNKRPCMVVSGPTGAMLHTLKRLGWQTVSTQSRNQSRFAGRDSAVVFRMRLQDAMCGMGCGAVGQTERIQEEPAWLHDGVAQRMDID